MKNFILLIFVIFSKNIFSTDKMKGISGSIKIMGESYLFKGRENRLKFYDEKNNFNLIVKIDRDNKDESSIAFVDNLKKYYILLTKREISSIATLKNLFSSKDTKDKNYQIKEIENSKKKIIGFEFKEYSSFSENSKINLFFSKDMDKYLKGFITYADFIDFLKDIDLSGIPFVDIYFEMIKYFINKSSELGFVGQIYINSKDLYSICSLKESIIKDEELEIPRNYHKKGIENLLENFY